MTKLSQGELLLSLNFSKSKLAKHSLFLALRTKIAISYRQLLIFHRLASILMIKRGMDINVSLEDQTSMAQNVKCLKIVVDVLQEQQ